ncbi:HAD-IB family phosphatase [Candidatus Saccharibacteria bacterium]|nr:HAD-IB family phosphatase [Candidatus Saccharibacteria bacterium]
MSEKKKFAVFDIDGTIGRTSLYFQVVEELINSGILSEDVRQELNTVYLPYRERAHKGAFRDVTNTFVEVFEKHMTSIEVSDFRAAVDRVIERSSKHVYVFTRALIRKLKAEGYFLIALTGSEMYSAQKFTEQFEFDITVGEIYSESKGIFTGEVSRVFDKKDKYIKQFVSDHNLTYVDSYAVGDSMTDAPMLALVENPIAFNPEDRLFDTAKKNGWKIVVERKNVIYELESKDGSYILAETDI